MAARGSRLHELVILENEPYNQELGISCSALGLASGMVRAHRSHVRTCGLGIRMSGPIFMILRGTVVGQVSFEAPPPIWAAQRLPNRVPLSPGVAVLLAISFGLCGGYLDLLFMLFRKFCWDQEGFVRSGRDFPWTVPLAHTLLLLIPGVAIAAISRLRPRFATMRAAAWLFAVLAIWAALLRLPLYGACTFVLAVGLGRPISAAVASRAWRAATVGYTLAGLLFLLGFLGAFSSGRQAIREHLAVAGLPPPPTAARNVVLIVWDTVRAYNLSPYGYPRNTTPNLARWRARASCITSPSHQLHGRTPRIAASSPADGLSSSIPNGRFRLIPRLRLLRRTWPRGAIKPQGSRRIRPTAVTRPDWTAASPITRISQ